MARGGRVGGFPTGIYDKRLSWQDPELRSTGVESATPSLGGFLVTTDFSTDLLNGYQAQSVLYPKTRKIALSTNANGVKIPGIDEASRASSRWGGIISYWENEGGTITASKPKFRNVELNLNKLTGLVYCTDEMLEDSAVIESVVREGFNQEFAFKVDDAVLRGTGAGQPLGILNGPSLVSVTGYTATTIAAQDVTAMFARMIPSSFARAEWYANVDCLPTMMRMSLGNNNYAPLWMPGNQLYNQPQLTLFGRPVNLIEQASTVGTVGDLLLLDLSQYITITKGGLKTAASIHVAFTTDEMAFRFILRIDGQPAWHSALTPYKGTNTLSPFVTLATR
jgi:HK97 family phage major capsid protein